ncbi:Putative Holliday junction resolvase [Serratia symbiotica]|nr:Putative Holliday junction resolvase [Serratia symbiotica]
MIYRTIISFDFGSKNIGIAVGQELTCSAYALGSFKTQSNNFFWKKIEKLFQEWKPNLLIVGLPLNMDGSEQMFTKEVYKFSNNLTKRFNIEVILHDERLTTIEARSYLFNKNGFRSLNKNNIDATSAVIILESWLKYQ